MNALPDRAEVLKALPRVAPGLERYCWLQAELQNRDVASDTEYRRRYAGFYRVRRGPAWRATFFRLLQERKVTGIRFAEALQQLADSTGRVEASFASKLVATIDPHQPVIDAVVLKNVGLRLPPASAADRLEGIVRMHAQLLSWYRQQLASTAGATLLATFRAQYPAAPVTDTKALDLVLWQIRSAA
jgi:hypothetical protein